MRLGPHDGFRPRLHAKMLIHALEMFLHRARTDPERVGDFLVRQALLEPAEDGLLSSCESVIHRLVLPSLSLQVGETIA